MLVYLDNSATTKPSAEVIRAMVETMETDFGNPSSLHRLGLGAEKAVKGARGRIASAFGADAGEIYFTSGGTESDNLAILGSAQGLKRKGKRIITSKVEHPAVLETFKALESQGFEAVYLDVDDMGVIDLEQLKSELNEETILVSLMHVNNELGTVEPVGAVGKLLQDREKVNYHVDAVQSFGKLPMAAVAASADLISISAHKIHGPKGMGVLYMKKGTRLKPPVTGGGQERNVRPGTENVPGIVGFGTAAGLACDYLQEKTAHIRAVRDYLLAGIKSEIHDIRINSFEDERCVASVLNISFLGIRGEVLLHTLEQKEIYVSTGSACASNKKGQSHVLQATGLTPDEIEGALRFSFSHENTKEQMDYALEHLKKAVADIRKATKYKGGYQSR